MASEEMDMHVHELEWAQLDVISDTSAVEHVADRLKLPGHRVTESEGSIGAKCFWQQRVEKRVMR